ncbi:Crp/Fnr family transcriptional regulator [Rhizosphaericola mali]|uniref:Crp/Fnr family transcriptional regulator n=1 Tax=Rhizosphaericola mali TaxID=2545455 RepID=A0A5P2G294_9BACT|nr:Crp/Fnr family transcriptional regulator [Rhizosphaericola mali]QES87952.1 Crp/Fnr family transcriptional regulator [Rhizosphaericola mali]
MTDALLRHIQKFIPFSENDWLEASKYFTIISAKKKEILLREGQICRSHYFVAAGCIRMYFIDKKGMEKTVQFGLENWWLADYFSFMHQEPSDFFIQSVLKSELWTLTPSAETEILDKHPSLEKYFRIVHQTAHAASQRRNKEFYAMSKEEIFYQFSQSFPDFVQSVPQYMLASYLDITPEYLSELRARNIS